MIYIVGIAFLSTALSVDLVDEGGAGIPYAAPIFKNADDCCSLTWEPLLQDESGSRFIPSTAIPAISVEESKTGSTAYWARHVDAGPSPHVGVIDDSLNSAAFFLDMKNGHDPTFKTAIEYAWHKVFVLSNPNNCVLHWQPNKKGRWKFASSRVEYPSMVEDLVLYARDLPDFVGGLHPHVGSTDEMGYSKAFGFKVTNQSTEMKNYEPAQHFAESCDLLAIDCVASLRSELRAELVELHSEEGTLFDKSLGTRMGVAAGDTKILSVTEMINESEFDQDATIELDSSVSSSLYMSHKTQLHDMVDTAWSLDGSVSVSFTVDLLTFEPAGGGEFNRNSMRDSLIYHGQAFYESHDKRFKYSGKVTLKGKTKSVVTMRTRHIKESHSYLAKYRIIDVERSKSNVTLQHVRESFRRQGFEDWDKLKEANGEIFYTTQGQMKIDTGIDTHIMIESFPVAGNSGIRKRRRIIDLDPLPYYLGDARSDFSSYSYQ